MTAEELMMFNRGTDMSSYEHFAISDKSSRRASGTSIAAITIAGVGTVAAIGAWIYAGTSASAVRRSSEREIDRLAAYGLAERDERVGQQNIVQKTIVDVAQGTFAGAGATAAATAQALSSLQNGGLGNFGGFNGLPTGGTIPVSLWQAPQQCCCPTPCGCNG